MLFNLTDGLYEFWKDKTFYNVNLKSKNTQRLRGMKEKGNGNNLYKQVVCKIGAVLI